MTALEAQKLKPGDKVFICDYVSGHVVARVQSVFDSSLGLRVCVMRLRTGAMKWIKPQQIFGVKRK